MTTLFISDLHLESGRAGITDLFLDFLAGPARGAEALYILGDLFEAWVGDDDPDPHHGRVAGSLRELAESGTPVRFLAGNRDFLLGERYAAKAGLERLEEPVRLTLYGIPTLLLHGDALCTDDIDYQNFRATVRDPGWQREFLARPLVERRALAADARSESQRQGARKAPAIMDVNPEAVRETFQRYRVQRVIHGHTHRPAVHHLSIDGRDCERIVLGDWYRAGSLLRVAGGAIKLLSFSTIGELS